MRWLKSGQTKKSRYIRKQKKIKHLWGKFIAFEKKSWRHTKMIWTLLQLGFWMVWKSEPFIAYFTKNRFLFIMQFLKSLKVSNPCVYTNKTKPKKPQLFYLLTFIYVFDILLLILSTISNVKLLLKRLSENKEWLFQHVACYTQKHSHTE